MINFETLQPPIQFTIVVGVTIVCCVAIYCVHRVFAMFFGGD